uniref:Ankyrin repeat and SOCS box containing 10 n=1 Tax=Cyprinus carpio TaxID=7962 RepID=A0A8C1K8N2_CYPCA
PGSQWLPAEERSLGQGDVLEEDHRKPSNGVPGPCCPKCPASGLILQFWNALLVGDDLTVISIVDDPEYAYLLDAIYDTSNIEQWKNFRFNYRGLRLWSLTYEQELTTPLHITAGRGFTECLQHLLMWGARVDLAPGGTTALHELLLQHGANPNATNEDSQMPLHVCTELDSLECAKHLLAFGALINAALKLQNVEGNTALNAACSQPQHCASLEHYSRVCHMLVSAGADIHISDADKQTPLHMASLVNEMDYGGDAPMHNILKAVAYKKNHESERIVQALLNYGSIRVWPGALPKVLKYCCTSPRTIEVLFNAYDRLKITEAWVKSLPPEVFQKHREFYKSLFALMQTPRSLQHLARHRLRTFLEGHLRNVIPKLGLPTFLKNDLMLAFRDYMH